jgi:hypothetical protein
MFSLRKLVIDLRPIDILTGEIAIEVTGSKSESGLVVF